MERLERVLVFLPVLVVSVVLHEVAHGWVARAQGDDTAERAGRLTLNPIPHIDLLGSIILPTLLLVAPTNFLFGWAKPVPVNPRNFRDYRRGDILVSLAGVAANLALALVCIVGIVAAIAVERVAPGLELLVDGVVRAGMMGIYLNVLLAIFNMLPIPPLDGSHLVTHLLPEGARAGYRRLGRYGLVLVLVLVFLFPGALSVLLRPAAEAVAAPFWLAKWLL